MQDHQRELWDRQAAPRLQWLQKRCEATSDSAWRSENLLQLTQHSFRHNQQPSDSGHYNIRSLHGEPHKPKWVQDIDVSADADTDTDITPPSHLCQVKIQVSQPLAQDIRAWVSCRTFVLSCVADWVEVGVGASSFFWPFSLSLPLSLSLLSPSCLPSLPPLHSLGLFELRGTPCFRTISCGLVYLFTCLTIYHLSIHPSIYPVVHQSGQPSMCSSICLSLYLSTHLFTYAFSRLCPSTCICAICICDMHVFRPCCRRTRKS